MKRQLFFIVVLGTLISFYGCASHELQLRLSGATRLNHSELDQLFYAERTVEFSSPDGNATVKYFPDGRQEIDWGKGNDQGNFRINYQEFCSTWTKLRNGEESCLKIYKISETEYEFIDSDGNSAAIMRLK